MRDCMRGFASLRTRVNLPMPPELVRPKRTCVKCGAVLRASNPGPECAPCTHEPIEVSDWMTAIIESDSRGPTLNCLAALILGCHRQTITKERNVGIRSAYAAGLNSKADLAELYGLSWQQIDDIMACRQSDH